MSEDKGLEDASNETLLDGDIEDLDTISADTIEDQPGFVDPPTGIYTLSVQKAATEIYVPKKGDNANKRMSRIKHIYRIDNVVEISDKSELIPPENALFSEQFSGNADGRKYWKFKAKAILNRKELGKATIKEICEELTNNSTPFRAKVINQQKTGDDGTVYTNIQVRVVQGRKSPTLDGGEVSTELRV